MPKTKTNTGTSKRFKRTSKGKILCKHVGMRHNLRKKTTQQKRRLNTPIVVDKADTPRIRQLLSY